MIATDHHEQRLAQIEYEMKEISLYLERAALETERVTDEQWGAAADDLDLLTEWRDAILGEIYDAMRPNR